MKILPLFLALLIALGSAAEASAHRLNVFAWLENDEVIVECNFGKDKPAIDADVTIIDSVTKRTLATGRSNSAGQYVFVVPEAVREGHGLVIDVNAGQGHHREWTMDASELYAAASLTAGFDASAIESAEQAAQASRPLSAAPTNAPATIAPAHDALTADNVRAIVHEAVETHMAPIRKSLAARDATGPGVIEIVGGLGWIIGLIGVYLIFRARRKNS
ncbi:MAG: cobalamin biosynthesis protein CbiL [Desulfovibrio sp.]|nr:cobalamin biosynthesis protein CbiL [Desulfovibrio sp.]